MLYSGRRSGAQGAALLRPALSAALALARRRRPPDTLTVTLRRGRGTRTRSDGAERRSDSPRRTRSKGRPVGTATERGPAAREERSRRQGAALLRPARCAALALAVGRSDDPAERGAEERRRDESAPGGARASGTGSPQGRPLARDNLVTLPRSGVLARRARQQGGTECPQRGPTNRTATSGTVTGQKIRAATYIAAPTL